MDSLLREFQECIWAELLVSAMVHRVDGVLWAKVEWPWAKMVRIGEFHFDRAGFAAAIGAIEAAAVDAGVDLWSEDFRG